MSTPHPFSDARRTGPPGSSEHERLTVAVGAGDVEALGALYDRYADRAFAVAWSILGTTTGAEDAVTDGTVDFWRRCVHHRPAAVSGGWLLWRVSAHALVDRRLGHGATGRLSGLTDTQCQVLALACAGRMSRAEIATEMQLDPTAVARTMTEAVGRLRASLAVPAERTPTAPPGRAEPGTGGGTAARRPPADPD
jgi:DNA-directed RNA polymerase specialized sigma24 family protein